MNERLKTVLVLFALTPFLVAGGGFAPPESAYTLRAPVINAHIVVDPHNTGATARRATIRLTRGALSASAFFDVPGTFPFDLGCRLDLMNPRFVSAGGPTDTGANFVPLSHWMPYNVARDLILAVAPGQVLFTPQINAIITSVDHASCMPNDVTGVLSFHARIHLIDFQ